MAQEILSIRMDKNLKKELGEFCSKVGLSISSVINMYARKVVDEQKIPFEISVKKKPDRLGYINAMEELKKEVIEKYPEQLSIEEINKSYIGFRNEYLNDNDSFGFDPYSKEDLLSSIGASILLTQITEDASKKHANEISVDEINEAIDEARRNNK